MPRDAVSRTANVERTARHKWVTRGKIDSVISEFIRGNINADISLCRPDWKNLHRLSERLSSLGIIGAKLRALLKPLKTIVL